VNEQCLFKNDFVTNVSFDQLNASMLNKTILMPNI